MRPPAATFSLDWNMLAIRCFAKKSMIRPTCSWWNGSLLTTSTSVRSRSMTASAASRSEALPELDAGQRDPGRRGRGLHLGEHVEGRGVVRIGEIGDARHRGDRLAQELQPLAAEIGAEHGIAGDVAARAGEARHQARAHRIADADHHDGDG